MVGITRRPIGGFVPGFCRFRRSNDRPERFWSIRRRNHLVQRLFRLACRRLIKSRILRDKWPDSYHTPASTVYPSSRPSARLAGVSMAGTRSYFRCPRDGEIEWIIVEPRDRLLRFGSEYVESAWAASGRRIVVVDESEMTDDLVRDMMEGLVSFCARLYGRRSARNKARKALKAIEE